MLVFVFEMGLAGAQLVLNSRLKRSSCLSFHVVGTTGEFSYVHLHFENLSRLLLVACHGQKERMSWAVKHLSVQRAFM